MRGKSDVDALIKGTDFERLDLLPADFSYRHMDLALDATKKPTRRLARVLAPLAGEYDYVFLDCPPSISLVSESVFEAADALLVPLIPATLSSRTFAQLREVVRPATTARGAGVLLDGRPPQAPAPRGDGGLAAEHDGVLRTAIPNGSDVERMGVQRTVVEDFAPGPRRARLPRPVAGDPRTAGGPGPA